MQLFNKNAVNLTVFWQKATLLLLILIEVMNLRCVIHFENVVSESIKLFTDKTW